MDPFENLFKELLLIDSQNERWANFCHVAITVIVEHLQPYIQNQLVGGERSGTVMARNALLRPTICYTLFLMYPDVLQFFVRFLKIDYGLIETADVRHAEQVAIFMFVVAHGASQHLVAAIFGLSVCAVNDHFHRVLHSVMDLANVIVQPHQNYNQGAAFHKPLNPRHAPFRDCIGAIDGTHVRCVAPKHSKRAYYGRKGYASQNVLAICDFNLCFVFASPGWEGCMHDSRVLRECQQKHGNSFRHPPTGKYYLVDQGYAHKTGYMGPYRGDNVRYHFQEFDNTSSREARRPKNPEEAFNYLHSSCRNVIERTFGVWKVRFGILNSMRSYHMTVQTQIVMATMVVHNFLRINQSNDAAFTAASGDQYIPFEVDENQHELGSEPSSSNSAATEAWRRRRDEILVEIMNQN